MSDIPAADSFAKRFAYKLGANFAGTLLSFFQAGIVSRALGPGTYGDYNFLTNAFNQFIAFLEMRSSTFLYTSVSSRRENRHIVGVYARLAIAISAIAVFFPIIVRTLGLQTLIWPGQNGTVIVVVAIVCLTLWYADLLAKLCDALGLTVSLEITRAANRVLFFSAIALLMRWGLINIRSYLAAQFAANTILIVLLALTLRKTAAFRKADLHPDRSETRQTLSEIFAYSHPIFVYSLMELLSNYADRWLLQKFGGSIQQGWFSLALNIGLAFNVLINALHPLIMREFSVAFAGNDIDGARSIFRRLIPASYTLSAIVLCYAAMNAEGCIRIVGGTAYEGATGVFAVMAFLPIIHNYSMLSGSALYAAGRTRLIRNIGLVTTPINIAATYFLIAPRQYGGLDLGAAGLAAKIVAAEFIGNNIVLFFNARMLGLRFRTYFFHQIYVVALLAAAAFGCKQAALYALPDSWLLVMAGGGILYAAFCALVFYYTPWLFGIDRDEILAFLKNAIARSRTLLAEPPL